MRHGDKIKNLSRTKAHRDALLANLGSQLIVNKRIVTTLAKAKSLRIYVEPLITKTRKGDSKEQIMHQHRVVFSYLKDKHAVKELFTVEQDYLDDALDLINAEFGSWEIVELSGKSSGCGSCAAK